MNKIVLVVLLLLTSCASKPYNKYITAEQKIKYLDNLEHKINEKTQSEFGHVILQYDLMGLDKQEDNPFGSYLYESLVSDEKITRRHFIRKIKLLERKVSLNAKTQDIWNKIAATKTEKMQYFKKIIAKLPNIEKKQKDQFITNKNHEDIFAVLDTNKSQIHHYLRFIQKYISPAPLLSPMESASRTSSFGYRKNPFDTKNNAKKTMHQGIDLQGAYRAPIYASASGIVKFAGKRENYGNLVIIDHGNGYETYYAHLYEAKVTMGQKILPHQVIASQGNSGRVTNTHLHYEIRYNNIPQDPGLYINTKKTY